MSEFKDYLSKADNYQGPTSNQGIQEDHEAILRFAARREDLVTEFENAIHSEGHSDWIELAKKGVKYYIERRSAKVDYYGRKLLDENIQPRIWNDASGTVAVIKVTM